MEINTKFKIGDSVVYKNRYNFEIGGFVVYPDYSICYFEDYDEEDNYNEEDLILLEDYLKERREKYDNQDRK